jgi:hypothetical protein
MVLRMLYKRKQIHHEQSMDFNVTPLTKQIQVSHKRIRFFKIFLALSLLVTGGLSGYISYNIVNQHEHQLYISGYAALAKEVFYSVNEKFLSKIVMLDHLSTVVSYECPTAAHWPNCSVALQKFQDYTQAMVEVSDSRSLASNPLVYPDQREGFEAFAYDLFEQESYPIGTGISSFGKGIFRNNEQGSHEYDDGLTNFSGYHLFLPVFLPANIENNWRGIMYNMHSEKIRAAAIDAVLRCVEDNIQEQAAGRSIVRECSAVSDFINLVSDAKTRPASIIFSPAFPHSDNTTLVGVNTLIMNWDSLLEDRFQNSRDVDCVVETLIGEDLVSANTFRLTNGKVEYLGAGRIVDPFFKDETRIYELDYGIKLATSIHYRLHFVPNRNLYEAYHSSLSIWACVICVVVICTISALFLAYDQLVKREAMENKLLLDSKRVFVRFVSHEVRTPINTITLGLQLLSDRLNALAGSLSFSTLKEGRHQRDIESGGEGSGVQADVLEEVMQLVDELADSSKTAVGYLRLFG